MRINAHLLLLAGALAAAGAAPLACEEDRPSYSDADADGDGDTDGDSDADSDADSDTDADDCSEETQLVYAVDQNNMFYSFDPMAPPGSAFQQIGSGPLSCPSGGQPFSMAVGRDGYAYILFVQGSLAYNCVGINKVDITTGVCEGLTPFSCGSSGFSTFGMGYVSDYADANTETLFIGDSDAPAQLGTIDIASGATAVVGSLAAAGPEFTGNGLGELWGFFPQAATPTVAQIDKANGQMIPAQTYPLSALSTDANAWAFAHWGGDYYIFYKTFSDDSTNVYKLDPETGDMTTHIANSGKYIVGAGVSTCAPTVIE